MNPEATQPAHEGTKSNSDPKESPFLSTIHGEAVPPPPSGCDTPTENSGATGDVVNANPSHTGAAGDVVNVNPSGCDTPTDSVMDGASALFKMMSSHWWGKF